MGEKGEGKPPEEKSVRKAEIVKRKSDSAETHDVVNQVAEALDVSTEELKGVPKAILIKMAKLSYSYSSWYGAIPPPDAMAKFEEIHSGAFDRILTMTEKEQACKIEEQAHKLEMEKIHTPNAMKFQKRGQSYGFIVTILNLLVVALCAYLNQPWIGVSAILSLAGILALLIKGKDQSEKQKRPQSKNSAESEEKEEE